MVKQIPGRGIRLFKKDGSSVYIPNKKYKANVLIMKRKASKLKWLRDANAPKQEKKPRNKKKVS